MSNKEDNKTWLPGYGTLYALKIILIICAGSLVTQGTVQADNPGSLSEVIPVINISPVVGDDTSVTALELTLERSEDNPGLFIPIKNIQINLTDPNGNGQDVVLCGSLNPAMNLSPGIPVYIIKRNKPVFFIVDAVGRGGCGGGGGGAGSQQRSNSNFSPAGTWEMEIVDISDLKSLGNRTFTV